MSNQSCPNCGHTITCGCQRRTASNGAQVCSLCLQAYEANLAAQKAASQQQSS